MFAPGNLVVGVAAAAAKVGYDQVLFVAELFSVMVATPNKACIAVPTIHFRVSVCISIYASVAPQMGVPILRTAFKNGLPHSLIGSKITKIAPNICKSLILIGFAPITNGID